MKSQRKNNSRKNTSRKNKKSKKNVKRNSRTRKMKGGVSGLRKVEDIVNEIKAIETSKFTIMNQKLLGNADNADKIGSAIADNKNITELVINNCAINNISAHSLFLQLRNSSVTSIDLQNNNLEGNAELISDINDYNTLTFLKLYRNPIAKEEDYKDKMNNNGEWIL